MDRPKLGQACLIHGVALKQHTIPEGATKLKNGKQYPHQTKWIANTVHFKAYYIGYRVVSEGKTRLEIDGDEYQTWSYPVYEPCNYRIVWMFVESEKHNPVYAFPEDVEALELATAPEKAAKGDSDDKAL